VCIICKFFYISETAINYFNIADVTLAQAAPAWFTQAFAQGGIADITINQAITNACAPNGVIDQAVNQAITNACAPNGAIYNLVDIRYAY
jgi:hypothetical protein